MNIDIMLEVIQEYYIDEVRRRREHLGNPWARAIILMDGHSSHKTKQIEAVLSSNGIDTAFLLPHSSHILQALDLGVFCKFKRELSHTMHGYKKQTKNTD
jgi:predicted ATP-dependent endonuclease of OLD family